ncbi:hypothetical protein ABT297_04210 [Dactylosporangium sp. NPDC000555]|uniref:hypothetical protein n=1 Tax=Dactylosporangium sp. NPDC000555 TaxID=3154260 RepID=UPI0033342B9E
MKYLVIDEDGPIRLRTAPRWDVARRDVGPEGWDRVSLPNAAAVYGPEHVTVAGYVNDCSALPGSRYARNLVGSCVLASLGAHARPYMGPVLLVGWDPDPHSADVEIRSLTDEQIAAIRQIHDDVRLVLRLTPGVPSRNATPAWREAMRAVAEIVRTGPAPQMTVLTDDDAMAHLFRGARR